MIAGSAGELARNPGVLRRVGGGTAIVLPAVADARSVLPLAGETANVALRVTLPSNLATGTYEVSVALPDAAPALAGDARYAVRFANVGTWDAAAGANRLNLQVEVRAP